MQLCVCASVFVRVCEYAYVSVHVFMEWLPYIVIPVYISVVV